MEWVITSCIQITISMLILSKCSSLSFLLGTMDTIFCVLLDSCFMNMNKVLLVFPISEMVGHYCFVLATGVLRGKHDTNDNDIVLLSA